jgi:ribonuclease D
MSDKKKDKKKGKKKRNRAQEKYNSKMQKFHKKHYTLMVQHVAALSAHAERTVDWLSHVEDQVPEGPTELSEIPQAFDQLSSLVASASQTLQVCTEIVASYSEANKVADKVHDKAFEKGSKPFTKGYPK